MPRDNPPKRARPRDLAGHLDAITRAAFQAGLNWRVVEAKWDGIREAFDGFAQRPSRSSTQTESTRS